MKSKQCVNPQVLSTPLLTTSCIRATFGALLQDPSARLLGARRDAMSPVPAPEPFAGEVLRGVRDAAGSDLCELRHPAFPKGEVLPGVRASPSRRHGSTTSFTLERNRVEASVIRHCNSCVWLRFYHVCSL